MTEYAVNKVPQKNGKFKFIQKYADPLTSTPDHIVTKTVAVTLTKGTKQAENTARKILKDKIDLKLAAIDKTNLTLQQLVNLYTAKLDKDDQKEKDANYQTHYVYKSHINIFLNDVDKNMIVDNIPPSFFTKYFDNMLHEKSYSYCNVRRAALWNLFNFGQSYDYIHNNPLQAFRLKHPKKVDIDQNIEEKYFTSEEYKAFIEDLQNQGRQDYVAFFKFLYYTGMRIGEGAALHTSDIIKKKGKYYAKVNGTMMKKHNGERGNWKKKPGAKSDKSNRIIYLPPEAVKIYKKRNWGQEFLFVKDTTKHPMDTGSVNHIMQKTAENIGAKKVFTSHFFRHTHVAKLTELDFDRDEIEARVGHGGSDIIRKIYYHITEKKQHELEAKLDKL